MTNTKLFFKWSLILLLFKFSIFKANAQVPSWEWVNSLHTDAEELSQDLFVFNYDYLIVNADSYK